MKEKIKPMAFQNIKIFRRVIRRSNSLNEWPEKVKIIKKWIGKSLGCEINFKIEGSKNIDTIKCYTTRPDTRLECRFVLSVDHPLSGQYENNEKFIA